jgi:hypothetical protein
MRAGESSMFLVDGWFSMPGNFGKLSPDPTNSKKPERE